MVRGTWILIAVVLAIATPSLAKNKAAARDAFQRGIEHYNLGEFGPALDSFRDAYRNFPDPSFLFNIGQCQRQLGQKREAILSYKAYLRESPDARNRDEVLSLVSALEQALKEEEQTRQRPPEGPMGPVDVGAAKGPATTGTTTGAPATGTTAPSGTTVPSGNSLTETAPAPAERTPVYKRWWLWTIVGGVVVAGVATGLAVGLTRGTSYPSATTSNGTFSF